MNIDARSILVLPSRLLLKSLPGSVQIANSGKHALYGNPPRWHKITTAKPAPKGAPVAAHPEAAGVHAPAKHFTDEQWSKLKLPAENVNAGSHNAAIDKIKQMSEAGHVTGILGAGYGTNTYGKKQAMVANKLLAMHGSPHQVVAGQKPGTHAAVQGTHDAALAHKDAALQEAIDHLKTDSGQADMPAGEASEDAALVQKLESAAAVQPVAAGLPAGAKITEAINAEPMIHTTSHGAAETILKDGFKPSNNSMYGKGVYFSSVAQSSRYGGATLSAKLKPHKQLVLAKDSDASKAFVAITGLHVGQMGSDAGMKAMLDAGVGSMSFPVDGETYTVVFDPSLIEAKLSLPKHLAKLVPKMEAQASFNDVTPPGYGPDDGAKEGDTKPAPTSTLTADQLGNLQSIPWFKLKLPDTNSNAPSHNKAVAKIEAMAFAGDVAGLQAFAASKADAKQSYAKKQHLLAKTAISALVGDVEEPKAAPVAAAPAAAKPAPASSGMTSADLIKLAASHGFAAVAGPNNTASLGKKGTMISHAYKSQVQADMLVAQLQEKGIAAEVHPTPIGFKVKITGKLDAADMPKVAPAKTVTLSNGKKLKIKPMLGASAVTPRPAAPAAAPVAQTSVPSSTKVDAPLYENTTAGHNKFWSVSVSGKSMKTVYGKIGTKGSSSVKDFPTEQAAKYAAVKLMDQKKAKGYAYKGSVVHEHDAQSGSAAVEPGPKDGDTKAGANGSTLVFKDGHWHKQGDAAGGSDGGWDYDSQNVAMDGAAPVGFDAVQVPDFSDDKTKWGKIYGDAAEKILAHMKAGGSLSSFVVAHKTGTQAGGFTIQIGTSKLRMKPGDKESRRVKMMAFLKQLQDVKAGKPIQASAPAPAAKKPKAPDVNQDGVWSWTPPDKSVLGSLASMSATIGGKKVTVYSDPDEGWMAHSGNATLVDSGEDAADVVDALKKHFGTAGNLSIAHLNALDSNPDSDPFATSKKSAESVSGVQSVDAWAQTGPQGGSNPGGKFRDENGDEWYCKFPADADTAKSEVLAAKLYGLAGLAGQDAKLVTKGGKIGIASRWQTVQKASSAKALAKVPDALSGFGTDAWLGNWDVIGMGLDNLQIGADGKAVRVDAGGSLEYRAQGDKKAFGPKVDEITTLLDAGTNPHSAAVFSGITKADLTASVAKVLKIHDVSIRAMVNEFGPGDAAAKAKLADTLIARKKDLAKRFPAAAKAKKAVVFKPEKISEPPSFMNWGGSGKSGPSSKEFVNQANHDAVQSIFAAAKTGDLKAVEGLELPVFDKDTGKQTGVIGALQHPSQHVKGYAQQAINEINYQLNPPKRFRFDGGHPLAALHAAFPGHGGAAASSSVQKAGKFLVLGEPGPANLSDLALPEKTTHSEGGGTLSQATYRSQARAAWAKMPKTQRDAIKAYTGSSYKKMNHSLWEGNPTGAAKAAGEALKTLSHDIQPGTVISRQLSLDGEHLNEILGAVGKVVQEPAIMSTSIRPSSWIKNVQFKLHVGPGVKGLWVGMGSRPDGGAISANPGEDEILLPPNTRLLILSKRLGGKDADGFGAHGQSHVIEAVILPTE